jgi:hypothetical protein
MAAKEFGDIALAEAAQNTLDRDCGRTESQGALAYQRGSNFANIMAAQARLMGRDDARLTFAGPPPIQASRGPILDHVDYPDVLVARAYGNDESLDLVLYPGSEARRTRLGFARLQPHRRYGVDGEHDVMTADAGGTGNLSIELNDRRHLVIRPLQ